MRMRLYTDITYSFCYGTANSSSGFYKLSYFLIVLDCNSKWQGPRSFEEAQQFCVVCTGIVVWKTDRHIVGLNNVVA
jgi:hypothetical protein